MDVELDERLIADRAEAVHFAGLDHENVTGARLECLSFHSPASTPGLNELDLVVRMTVRPWTSAGHTPEQEYRRADVAMVAAHEPM